MIHVANIVIVFYNFKKTKITIIFDESKLKINGLRETGGLKIQ